MHRDDVPRRPLKNRSYSTQGGLELEWDSCWYRDAMYRIEKYLGNENGPLIGTSTSRNSSYSDMTYAEEKALYRVYLSGDGGSRWHPWYEITCDSDLPLPVLDIHEHQLLLHWPYKEYFQNIHGFRLKDPDGGSFQEDVAAGDTSIILEEYYFGGDKDIEFHVIPGSDPGYYRENPAAFSNTSSHFFAERMPYVSGKGLFAVLNESRLLFQQHSHNVQVLDLDSYKIVDSLYS
jgi:hypothetical protein